MTKVPIIGTFRGRFSNHWKNGALLAALLPFAAGAAEVVWSTNRFEEGTSLASAALEAEHVRGPAAPLRKASQRWNLAWPSSTDPELAVRLRTELSRAIDEAVEDDPFPVTTGDSPEPSIRVCSKAFNRAFKDLLKLDPASAQRYEAIVDLKPVLTTSNLVASTAGAYVYSGGAHGTTHRRHVVCDARTGERLSFDRVFPETARSNLLAAITESFRAAKGLAPAQSLKDGGLFEDSLILTSNYVADATGIGFTYEPYEVAPYCEGMIEVRLSYARARDLLATGTALRAEADERLGGTSAP